MIEVTTKTFPSNHWRMMMKCTFGIFIFWITTFAFEYFYLTKNLFKIALIRSFAISGEILIGLTLFASALFKWYPRLAVHWRIRRYLGVSGFILIFFHVIIVMKFIFKYNFNRAYYSFNPLVNPIIFGTIAYIILFVMAITSTDWMVKKLTPRLWKFIHRFVYIAYISSLFHFILMNSDALNNPLGYFLYAVTSLALFGQVFWFLKISFQKRFKSLGSFVGISLIVLTLLVGYILFLRNK